MDRTKTPVDVEAAVLLKSCRRCALCFHLHNDLSEKNGQIAHLNKDPADCAEDNLVWLCLNHHTLYDSRTSQHKNYTIQEVKAARARLYEVMARRTGEIQDHREEQDPRSDGEHRLIEEDSGLGAVVELGKRENSPEVIGLCYNLGTAPFVIDRLIVRVQGGITSYSDLIGPHVVIKGDFVAVRIDCSDWVIDTFREANITFQIKGAARMLTTEPVWFYLYPQSEVGYGWNIGRLAERQPGAILRSPRIIPSGE